MIRIGIEYENIENIFHNVLNILICHCYNIIYTSYSYTTMQI